jgi:anti-anti-sigma factor
MTFPQVDIERDGSNALTVARFHGDIDASNVADVMLPLADEAREQPLVLDLSDVQYLDSAAISAIEKLHTRRDALYLIAPRTSIVRRALEIVWFDQLMPIVERMEDIPHPHD